MDKNSIALTKSLEHKDLILWAKDCAYHVLDYFEENNPLDYRPRKAIEAIDKWFNNELTIGEVRKCAFSAHRSARESNDEKAIFAARSAGHAAATVHVKTHAVHAANYAQKVFLNSEIDKAKESLWQYNLLLNIQKGTIK